MPASPVGTARRCGRTITTPILENVRRKLGSLVHLIEKVKRKPVYSDFEDEIADGQELELPGFAAARFERFREKARAFLRDHADHPAMRKLRRNEPITPPGPGVA